MNEIINITKILEDIIPIIIGFILASYGKGYLDGVKERISVSNSFKKAIKSKTHTAFPVKFIYISKKTKKYLLEKNPELFDKPEDIDMWGKGSWNKFPYFITGKLKIIFFRRFEIKAEEKYVPDILYFGSI